MTIQKLTKEFLLSRIAYPRYVHHEGTTLTHCLLTMKNGIVVDGKSACLNPADFDAEMGRKIAYDNAFAKLWELEGYARASEHEQAQRTNVIVNCINPAKGNAEFLRGIEEAFRAAKRKPTVTGPHQDTQERVRWSLHSLLGDTLLTSTKPLTWAGLRDALENIEREDVRRWDIAYSVCCWDKQTVLDARSIVGPVGDEWGERNDLHAAVCVIDRTGGLQ